MNSTENKSAKATYQAKAATSLDVFFIIILGVAGMLVTFQYLLSDLQINGYKKELWLIKGKTNQGTIEKIISIDTLIVTFHPQIGTHVTNIKSENKANKKNRTTDIVNDKEHLLDFSDIYFAYNSAFLVWMAIFSILVGCSLALLPIILSSIKNIVLVFDLSVPRRLMVIFSTILIGVLIYFMQHVNYLMKPTQILDKFNILLKNPYRLDVFIAITIAIALMAIAGQLFVNQAIGKLPPTITGLDIVVHNIIADKFNLLRNKLKFFLLIDAVLIVFSVVNTDAFRSAIISEVNVNMDIIPRNFVYLYGILFTFILAIVYMPIYYRLKNKGELMLKEIPEKFLKGDGEKIATVLKIRETPIESLRVALSILAPILTSLVPGLLNI